MDSIIQEQAAGAQINKAQALALVDKINNELAVLRNSTNEKLQQAQEVEREWLAVEAEMYKSLQPFSMESLKARMARAVVESEQLSESLATSFLEEGSGTISNDDINDFIKNYRQERKTYHMRSEIMERWKEDRVARNY